jgi:hypothetical protein
MAESAEAKKLRLKQQLEARMKKPETNNAETSERPVNTGEGKTEMRSFFSPIKTKY